MSDNARVSPKASDEQEVSMLSGTIEIEDPDIPDEQPVLPNQIQALDQ